MSRLLRCSVVSGLVGALCAVQPVNAGETLGAYSTQALEKISGKRVVVRDRPDVILSTPDTDQTLVLNCEKIGQAQRSLDEALKNGATIIPAAPSVSGNPIDVSAATAPVRGAEAYHIQQNQRRMDALAQKFGCATR